MNRRYFGIATVLITMLGAQSAAAYDYKVCNTNGIAATYVHVVTVSSFCHDRTPVDVADGDAPLANSNCVSGTTAPGCLISNVAFVDSRGTWSWSTNIGVAGATWTLRGTQVCRGDWTTGDPGMDVSKICQ